MQIHIKRRISLHPRTIQTSPRVLQNPRRGVVPDTVVTYVKRAGERVSCIRAKQIRRRGLYYSILKSLIGRRARRGIARVSTPTFTRITVRPQKNKVCNPRAERGTRERDREITRGIFTFDVRIRVTFRRRRKSSRGEKKGRQRAARTVHACMYVFLSRRRWRAHIGPARRRLSPLV